MKWHGEGDGVRRKDRESERERGESEREEGMRRDQRETERGGYGRPE